MEKVEIDGQDIQIELRTAKDLEHFLETFSWLSNAGVFKSQTPLIVTIRGRGEVRCSTFWYFFSEIYRLGDLGKEIIKQSAYTHQNVAEIMQAEREGRNPHTLHEEREATLKAAMNERFPNAETA